MILTPLAIIDLITKVGWPLAQQLITLYHSGNAPTTPEQWTTLAALGNYSSADSLAKAGVKIENGVVVPTVRNTP